MKNKSVEGLLLKKIKTNETKNEIDKLQKMKK